MFITRRKFILTSSAAAAALAFLGDEATRADVAATYADLDPARIASIETLLPMQPVGFGPNYHDRSSYEPLGALPKFSKTLADAGALLLETYPAWSDDAYLDFSKTGQRTVGQTMIGKRQNWLAPLVWAECIENKGNYVATINMVLNELATQRCWTLPAHDVKLTSFNGTGFLVELNSAALAHDLAQSLYMLDDKIDPAVRTTVMTALEQRIFSPIRQQLSTKNKAGWAWWMMPGANNWNAVCLAGVTGAALTALPDRKQRAVFAAAAESYSQNFVASYYDDGYCTEGLGYFNYGFGAFVVLREKLWQATNGHVDLFKDPKVKRMAEYGPNIEIINREYPAIGDCPFGTKVDKEITWYCSRVLGLGLAAYDAITDLEQAGPPAKAAMYVFPNSASAAIPSPASSGSGLRTYFEDAAVLICRPAPGGTFGAELAGGNNGKSHNHNDVGSFSIVIGDAMPIGDPGGPKAYDAGTFGPLRYTKYQIFRSRTHPVPLVAGSEQKAGKQYSSKILDTDFTDSTDRLVLDLSGAYAEPKLTKLVRTFVFSRDGAGSLEVTDEFEFNSPQSFEVSLETHGTWLQPSQNTLSFAMGGETLVATIEAPVPFIVTPEVCAESEIPFTRLGIALNSQQQSGTVKMTFRSA